MTTAPAPETTMADDVAPAAFELALSKLGEVRNLTHRAEAAAANAPGDEWAHATRQLAAVREALADVADALHVARALTHHAGRDGIGPTGPRVF